MPVSKGKYTTNFPRAVNYHDPIEITKAFPNLKYVNSSTFDYTRINYADFFVIKSTNDDDVHKVLSFFSKLIKLSFLKVDQIWYLDQFHAQQHHLHRFLETRQAGVFDI